MMNHTHQKKLSILVVVYNASELLAYTLQRILAQKTPDVELVVWDGNSTDDTLSIIKRYASEVDVLRSERDAGIYDAMNKAMELASGEFLWFINAGDAPAEGAINEVLSLSEHCDVIYGETLFTNGDGEVLGERSSFTTRKLPKELKLSCFLKGQVVSHQAFIPKRALTKPYDLSYAISADIDWQLHVLKQHPSVSLSSRPLALYLHGGTSKQHAKKAWKERFEIMTQYFGLIRTIFAHVNMVIRAAVFMLFERRND